MNAPRHSLQWAIRIGTTAIAIATAGVVYSHWVDTLDATIGVQTGEVVAGWSGAICSEFVEWPWPAEATGEFGGGDVASVSWTIPNLKVLEVTVDNAYPSYAVDCEIEWANNGTVPVIIRGWRLVQDPNNPSNLENCIVTGPPTGQNVTLTCDELTVQFVDGVGSQIDPGVVAASSLRFHVEQDDGPTSPNGGNQDTLLSFGLEVCVSNWNEPQAASDCFVAADSVPTP